MDVVDDWGRKAAVSSTGESTPPFFSHPSDSELLFSSPSLSPPILHRVPHLTHARFLTVSGGIPPSSSSAIESSFRIPHPNDEAARVLSYNRLQFLPFPCNKASVLVFFPTGTNLDQLGFVVVSVTGDGIRVMGLDKGEVFVAKERFFSRVLKISVQPSSSDLRELGYVMVCLLYSVHWYCVRYDESRGRPVLTYIGGHQFKSCSVASACWSSQLTGECLVLLENGEVFLFELNERHSSGFRGCKMKVSWEDHHQGKSWLGCEFGWRLETFIVARSDAVFVITRTSGSCCSVRALLESESLNMAGTEEFVSFAKAGGDSFRFLLASRSSLYLCDQSSGVPLLKWQHDVQKPCFMDVYSLSDLGLQTDESAASCVVVGSFWNAESQMFCYGSSPSVANDSSSLCVWELPHNLLSPAGKCLCGDCKIREVIMKESLPVWIDWQKKRVLVLGFGVLNKYLPSLSSSDGGFTLIQLTSSGKLEAVKFRASPSLGEVVSHRESTCESDEVNLLYFPDDNIYKLPRRFKYLELDYLSAYTKGNLAKFLEFRMSKKRPSGSKKKKSDDSLSLTYHEELCEKLSLCGFGRDRCSSTVTAVFNSISSPTSVFDVALRETWSSLPMELLLLAFSNYTEVEGVLLDKKKPSLEFLSVPEFPQLPPFLLRKPSRRSSKWSKKIQPGVDLIGPVLPLPVLLTLHELRNGCPNSEQQELFSPDAEFSDRCNEISKAAREMANSGASETTISLDDDMWLNSDSQKEKKRFIAYSPITKTDDSYGEHEEELTKFVSKVRRKDSDDDDVGGGGRSGLEVLDDMSPVEICFEDRDASFDMKALFMCKALVSQWQDRSTPYQDFLSQYHLHK